MYVYSRFPAFPFYDFPTEFPRATGSSRRPGNTGCDTHVFVYVAVKVFHVFFYNINYYNLFVFYYLK